MTHVTCRLTVKNRDQPWNPTLGNRVWATFTFLRSILGEINYFVCNCIWIAGRSRSRKWRTWSSAGTCMTRWCPLMPASRRRRRTGRKQSRSYDTCRWVCYDWIVNQAPRQAHSPKPNRIVSSGVMLFCWVVFHAGLHLKLIILDLFAVRQAFVLLCCWLGARKGIWPVKILSGVVLVLLSV